MYKVTIFAIGLKGLKKLFEINAVADGFIPDTRFRFFVDEDNNRWEIYMDNVIIVFDSKRAELIEERRKNA